LAGDVLGEPVIRPGRWRERTCGWRSLPSPGAYDQLGGCLEAGLPLELMQLPLDLVPSGRALRFAQPDQHLLELEVGMAVGGRIRALHQPGGV
jgi:hypothetical protein